MGLVGLLLDLFFKKKKKVMVYALFPILDVYNKYGQKIDWVVIFLEP